MNQPNPDSLDRHFFALMRADDFKAIDSPHEREAHSLRFENAGLQKRFVAALRKAGLTFDVRDDGAVTCAADNWPAVSRVAGTIRDSHFRWYYSWWKDPESARLFWEEMKAIGLPFEVEHHNDRLGLVTKQVVHSRIFLVGKLCSSIHHESCCG